MTFRFITILINFSLYYTCEMKKLWQPVRTVSDGITFLSTGRYYEGINRWVAHKLKDGDNDAIDYAAR